jgi:uncharacterized membrane-anchored protein
MSKLPNTRSDAAKLADAASFNPGSTYADYKPGVDQKATFGVAGLVAAGLGLAAAKKFGLLALLALFGKKLIILVVAAFAGVANWFRQFFRKKTV